MVTDTIGTDTTKAIRKVELPHYDIADLFPDKPAIGTSRQRKWSVDLAYTGGFGEQNYNRPYSFTEMPTLVISGEPPSPVTFETGATMQPSWRTIPTTAGVTPAASS